MPGARTIEIGQGIDENPEEVVHFETGKEEPETVVRTATIKADMVVGGVLRTLLEMRELTSTPMNQETPPLMSSNATPPITSRPMHRTQR